MAISCSQRLPYARRNQLASAMSDLKKSWTSWPVCESTTSPVWRTALAGSLRRSAVKLVSDLRGVSKERLTSVLGPKTGDKLWEYARGIDRAEVGEQPVRKSVSAEVNWGIRFVSQDEAEEFVMNLCKELEKRLLNEGVKGRNLTMKIMRRSMDAPLDPPKHLGHGKCDTFNKTVVFGVATNDAESLGKEAMSILRSFKFSPGDLRGIGVQLQKLEPIKASAAAPDGSQRRLSFGNHAVTSPARKRRTEPIEDEPVSKTARSNTSGKESSADPIADDPLTPRKPKHSPFRAALALAKAGRADEKAQTPLNMTGTQFIMPTNPDPSVLAELPNDIRRRLIGQQKGALTKLLDRSPSVGSRTRSPATLDDLPPEVDREVFNGLPDDMKAEVLAMYGRSWKSRRPPSPPVDTAGQGTRNIFGDPAERDVEMNLRAPTESETDTMRDTDEVDASDDHRDMEDELDIETIAELPDDVRRQVVDNYRHQRLARRSGPPSPRRRRNDMLPGGQTTLQFAAPPRKIGLTSSALTSARQAMDMLNEWHWETRNEGPHQDDVDAFGKYLADVVVQERDMDKVRRLVVWLDWIVGNESDGKGKRSWSRSVAAIKDGVQQAMETRGLGPMKL